MNILLIVLMLSVLFCTISILELRGRLRETTRVIKLLGDGYARLEQFANGVSELTAIQNDLNLQQVSVNQDHQDRIQELSAILRQINQQRPDEPTSH